MTSGKRWSAAAACLAGAVCLQSPARAERVIEVERVARAPASEVWRAFATGEGLNAALLSPVTIDLLETLTDDERRILGEHFQYLKRLTHEGRIVVAGPCTDRIGPGIVVFRAENEAAARELMENDPAVKHGVFRVVLHPMRLSLVGGRE